MKSSYKDIASGTSAVPSDLYNDGKVVKRIIFKQKDGGEVYIDESDGSLCMSYGSTVLKVSSAGVTINGKVVSTVN